MKQLNFKLVILFLISFAILPTLFSIDGVAYSQAPLINSFSPINGCAQTTSVTINGANFVGVIDVKFGGASALSYVVNSPTQITAIPNNGVTGIISVEAANGIGVSMNSFTVNPLPTVTASASPATICLGDSSTLNAAGIPNIGGGGYDQTQLVNNTCMANFSQTGLAQSFVPSVSSICGAGIQITSGGTGDVTIQLYTNLPTLGGVLLASGTATGGNPNFVDVTWASVNVTIGTTYYLVFTSTNGGQCIAGDLNNGYPNGMVFANAGYSPFPSYDYTFRTATCGAGGSYLWMPGNLNIPNPKVSPNVTTTYTVVGTDGNGCSNSASTTVTISPSPTVSASFSPATVCAKSVATPIASGNGNFTWSGGLVNNVPFVALATTTYTVTNTNPNGCTASTIATLNVTPASGNLAPATSNHSQNHADGFDLNYYNTNCDLIASIKDTIGGNILGATNTTVNVEVGTQKHNGQPWVRRWYQINPTNNGNANVTLYFNQSDFTDYNTNAAAPYLQLPTTGSNSDPNKANIRITKNTLAGLGNNPVVITPTVNWTGTYWEVNFNTTPLGQYRIHSANPGNIPLDVISFDSNNDNMDVYPNPTSDILNIDLNGISGKNIEVKVLDISGRVVKQMPPQSIDGNHHIELKLNNLVSGLYIIQVYTDNKLTTSKKISKND